MWTMGFHACNYPATCMMVLAGDIMTLMGIEATAHQQQSTHHALFCSVPFISPAVFNSSASWSSAYTGEIRRDGIPVRIENGRYRRYR